MPCYDLEILGHFITSNSMNSTNNKTFPSVNLQQMMGDLVLFICFTNSWLSPTPVKWTQMTHGAGYT